MPPLPRRKLVRSLLLEPMPTTWFTRAVDGQSSGKEQVEESQQELQFMMSRMYVFSENPDSNFVKEGNFSYAIVVVKETPYAEMHGNRVNLTIPEPGPNSVRSVREAVKCGDCRCPVWIL
ncbi:hypothetical protein KSP40_PGU004380 [Platanthera guangdongensis]|uniref:beta-glucosidase n=1 Tax=Platanthera guangdongensis TaxID=2320717 RepID=A0ABR2N504_9ASPA